MLTNITPILDAVSRKLKEPSTDTSQTRIGYVNDAIHYVLGVYKWGWSRKKHTLTPVANQQEYVLTTTISDYSPIRGIFEIYFNGEKIGPVPYNNRSSVSSSTKQHFYLLPDDATLGFTSKINGNEQIDIWYYAEWTNVSSPTADITLKIPESMVELIALYVKYLVHDGKRQRFDARNALLDFKQALDTLIPQQASAKIKDLPRRVYNFFSYLKFRRNYEI